MLVEYRSACAQLLLGIYTSCRPACVDLNCSRKHSIPTLPKGLIGMVSVQALQAEFQRVDGSPKLQNPGHTIALGEE